MRDVGACRASVSRAAAGYSRKCRGCAFAMAISFECGPRDIAAICTPDGFLARETAARKSPDALRVGAKCCESKGSNAGALPVQQPVPLRI